MAVNQATEIKDIFHILPATFFTSKFDIRCLDINSEIFKLFHLMIIVEISEFDNL